MSVQTITLHPYSVRDWSRADALGQLGMRLAWRDHAYRIMQQDAAVSAVRFQHPETNEILVLSERKKYESLSST